MDDYYYTVKCIRSLSQKRNNTAIHTKKKKDIMANNMAKPITYCTCLKRFLKFSIYLKGIKSQS